MKTKIVFILNSNFNEIFSEIGGIKYLIERGIIPDVIIATSFSSINAIFIAKNPTTKGIEEGIDFYKFLKKEDVLDEGEKSIFEEILPIKVPYSYRKLISKLGGILPKEFRLLKIPTYIMGYDTNRNEIKVFGMELSDNIANSIACAISIPGIYKPYESNYISANLYPILLIEFALKLRANSIYYFIGDYNKLSEIIAKDYKLLLNQNYKEFFEEISKQALYIHLFETKTDRKLFDFTDIKSLVDEGYRNTRKRYTYYRLFKHGRVRETLELLKRSDLDDEEKIIKAYAFYMEGEGLEAYNLFSELYKKYPNNELVIGGYIETLTYLSKFDEAYDIIEKLDKDNKNPYILVAIGQYYHRKGEVARALDYYKLAMENAKDDPIAYGIALRRYGSSLYILGEYREAFHCASKALENFKKTDNAYELANSYYLLMLVSSSPLLFDIYEKLIDICGSSFLKFQLYSEYAHISCSIDYAKKALEIAKEKKNLKFIGRALSGVSEIYVILKDYDRASVYAIESLEIARQSDDLLNELWIKIMLLAIKILQNNLKETLEIMSLLPDDEEMPSVLYAHEFNFLKLCIYSRLNQTENYNKVANKIKENVKEIGLSGYEDIIMLSKELSKEIDKELSKILDIKELIMCGANARGAINIKLENEPKSRIEFLENLNNENSIYYIDEIKRLSKDKHLRIYIYNFTEQWRANLKQYIIAFRDFLYFINDELRNMEVFNDNFNLIIFLYLLANREKVLTYGNISIAFGMHSENIKERLRNILEVIEPWVIAQNPKYIIMEEDKVLFRTDENLKVDFILFEEYIKDNNLESAINLYRGDFVPSINHPFFNELRKKLKDSYLNAVYKLSREYIESKNYDRGIVLLEDLLNREITNLRHLILLISTLYKIGKRAKAYEWYIRYLSVVDEAEFKFEEAIR